MDYKKRTADFFAVLFGGGGAGSQLTEKWGWYPTIYQLANEDLLRMDEVTEKPVGVVFQHLAFLKDYAYELKRQ